MLPQTHQRINRLLGPRRCGPSGFSQQAAPGQTGSRLPLVPRKAMLDSLLVFIYAVLTPACLILFLMCARWCLCTILYGSDLEDWGDSPTAKNRLVQNVMSAKVEKARSRALCRSVPATRHSFVSCLMTLIQQCTPSLPLLLPLCHLGCPHAASWSTPSP